MCCKGILKRVLPFIVTLVIGLFVASFFVDLRPRPFVFQEGRRGHCHDFENLYYQEHERAERLQEQLDRMKQGPVMLKLGPDEMTVPPPPPPPVKLAPRVVR
jgi:hypothetical protein